MRPLFLLWIFQFSIYTFLYADVILIVHEDSPISSISKSEIQDIFANKKQRWGHGGKIELVTFKGGPVQDEFCSTILGKSASQFKQFWRQLVFTGHGSSPKEVNSTEEMLNLIGKEKSAIGFVPADTKLLGVKAVTLE